jgi:hypothetical protein
MLSNITVIKQWTGWAGHVDGITEMWYLKKPKGKGQTEVFDVRVWENNKIKRCESVEWAQPADDWGFLRARLNNETSGYIHSGMFD